jgi:ATP-binding cassette subfamily B protein/subfamily B ATP-binding cassette protein MsbA
MLLGIGVLSCAASAVAVLTPWPLKMLVDCALGDQQTPAWVARSLGIAGLQPTTTALVAVAAIASLVVYLLGSIVNAGLSFGWTAAGQRMVYDLAGDLFARLQRLSLLFHGKTPVGDSLSRLSGDAWCVYTVCEGALVAPIQHILTLALVGGVAWRLDPRLAAVAFCVAPLLGASAYFFGRRLRKQTKINREAQARLTSFVHTTLGAIPLVQAYTSETRNVTTFHRLADEALRSTRRGSVLKQAYTVVNSAATTLGTAIVLYLGGRHVLSGTMTLGSLLVFLAYLRTIQGASQGLLSVYGSLKGVEPSIDRVTEVLDVEVGVRESATAQALPPCRDKGAEIQWENVSFGYEPQTAVLSDVTLSVKPGQMLAVVGPTGAGKSTLVSLIPRFFDPWSGRVAIDGQDLRTVKLSDLRARVSIVLQEPFLLPLSVADNIAYGWPGAGRDEIVAAAVAANADGFIRALPLGYDTVIGERGASLSGGERQRLAIARAILKDAPILILDEPTASLDAQTEASVMGALERLTQGRTTIVIAHRLSTVRRADAVAVIQDGRLAEFGTHEELMRQDQLYRKLNELQFGLSPRTGVLV